MARAIKTLLRKHIKEEHIGFPHREHRSKKGRRNLPEKQKSAAFKRRLEAIRIKELEREARRVL